MRFKGLDLNLLLALDVLIELKNVSRAADRLGLTQPAASAALARLRDYFGDELLVVHGKRMFSTPFAERLMPHVKACLSAAEAAITTSSTFTPATAERTFRIVASDYVTVAVIARVARQLAASAPGLRFDLMAPDDSATERLSRGEVDMMITPEEYVLEGHPTELLYEESHVIVGCKNNPFFKGPMDTEAYFAAPHVTVLLGSARTLCFADKHVESMGRQRDVMAAGHSFTTLPWLLADTDRLALMHKRLAVRMVEHFPISQAPLPFPFPVMREMAQYHLARNGDEGLHWLIRQIRAVAQTAI